MFPRNIVSYINSIARYDFDVADWMLVQFNRSFSVSFSFLNKRVVVWEDGLVYDVWSQFDFIKRWYNLV